VLYGLVLSALLLIAGSICRRTMQRGNAVARAGLWLLCAGVASAVATLATAGRADLLLRQGVVQAPSTMHLNAFALSFTMGLLYLAHLRRSHTHRAANARLAGAQAGQREARRRTVQVRLQALQARIDPQLLFEMLEAVRRTYEVDVVQAEQLLDELIAFLRAALPRLRTASSSLAHEAELARTYARLLSLAGAPAVELSVEVSAGALHARFPPGILLPLLAAALRECAGPCALAANCDGAECRCTLTLPAPPADATLARVRALLADIHGAGARVVIEADPVRVTITVPHELA
jgi:hypothetical protein